MSSEKGNILAVNGGSSSIKFCVYGAGGGLEKLLSGKIERIGQENSTLTYTDSSNGPHNGKGEEMAVKASDLSAAGIFLLGWLEKRGDVFPLAAVGHRVVHGGPRTAAAVVDDALLSELERLTVYDPDHLPGEIGLMRVIRKSFPDVCQIACFDTAFHANLPAVAKLLPIPRKYMESGMRRYGFHGLSYSYILSELVRVAGPEAAMGSVIVAHLGSGASLAAIKDGVSVDTTMGFTPAGGVVMGTRPGDLDPGVLWAILDQEKYSPEQLDNFINHQCGLLGVSETSPDMQELLAKESSDSRAADAVALFCYQIRKAIGAFSAVLGGLDVLVFTGGIGERSSVIRSRICAGLGYLGIELDQRDNAAGKVTLSGPGVRARVYAIPTDEELMIAKIVNQLL